MKIAIIIPYFGRFPNYFNFFLKSCFYNPDIDWIIFTDNEISDYDYTLHNNVFVHKITFMEFKLEIQNKFEFEIALNVPYKLCDYKPAYGYLFESYLKNYDYWGYCDIDMIFGDIKKYLPNDVIKKYDKIGHLGHFTLYKNQNDINTLFMKPFNNHEVYKEVFSTDRICIFDEWGDVNINFMFHKYGKKIFYWNDFCDIYPYDDNFCQVACKIDWNKAQVCNISITRKPLFILWDRGKVHMVYLKKGKISKRECAYAHFQKRIVNCTYGKSDEQILCTPNQFIKYNDSSDFNKLRKKGVINKKRISHIYGTVKYFIIEKTGPIRHMFRRGYEK